MRIKVVWAPIESSSAAADRLAVTTVSASAWASGSHSAVVEVAMPILGSAAAWGPQGDSIVPRCLKLLADAGYLFLARLQLRGQAQIIAGHFFPSGLEILRKLRIVLRHLFLRLLEMPGEPRIVTSQFVCPKCASFTDAAMRAVTLQDQFIETFFIASSVAPRMPAPSSFICSVTVAVCDFKNSV